MELSYTQLNARPVRPFATEAEKRRQIFWAGMLHAAVGGALVSAYWVLMMAVIG